jgi:uncharacterized protein DUF3224
LGRARAHRAGRGILDGDEADDHEGGWVMSISSVDEQRTHATGKIDVKTYEPTPYDQPAEGPPLVRINVVEDFSGDIAGEGVATFLQVTAGEDEASFVGVERVTGSLGGRSGTFVLQDEGTVKGSTVSGSWFVVPGSGTGELKGLRGEGGFSAELGQGADITLDYWFE